jgi:hypothetical protein
MSDDDNIDPVRKWWWLRECKKGEQEKPLGTSIILQQFNLRSTFELLTV